MEFTPEEKKAFSKMGKKARSKKFQNMTPLQISAYMKNVRAGKKENLSAKGFLDLSAFGEKEHIILPPDLSTNHN